MDRTEVEMALFDLRRMFRLGDWLIDSEPDPEMVKAVVDIEREQRVAIIRYNPDAVSPEVLGHEMCHVLLADMDFIANNGRSIDIMEAYNLFEERVCNVVGGIIAQQVRK